MSSTIEKYLRAWKSHDTSLVRELFDVSAVYDIAGKEPLRGIEEICRNWERNKRRQYNLKIFPPLKLSDTQNTCSFVFCARFTDLEEKERQTAYGRIELQHRDGKILTLTESYLLERRRFVEATADTLIPAIRPVAGVLRRTYWQAKNLAKLFTEFFLARGATVFIYLMAILLGYSAFNLTDLPDWLLKLWALSFFDFTPLTDQGRNLLTARAYHNVSGFASLFVFLVLFGSRLRYRIRQPITIINLQAPDHDLSVMKRRFKNARHLVVFAGDFDFVGRDRELCRTFQYLHAQNSLVLVSDKSEAEVRRGFGNQPDAIYLFEGLKQNQQILFSNNQSIRCSIVRGWLGSEIIYRYEGGGADSLSSLHLCIMRGRREAKPLMELVEKLVKPIPC